MIAFFDLDRTLISRNSGGLWLRRERRLGYVGRREAAKAVGWLVRYHFGAADLSHAIRSAVSSLADTPEAALRARTLAFYEDEVRGLVRPGATTALAEHRAAGEACVMLTTSSNYLAEPVSEALGLDDFLSNRFEVIDGTFTGQPLEPLCFGPGKVTLAADYAGRRGVRLQDCAFYSDSASDLPMLEAVGRPVVVSPDPKLKRIAAKRNWPVQDWG